MDIDKCKLIPATSIDEFGDICTCIEDKGNGNAVAASDVDDEYESLLLTAPEMYKYLDRLLMFTDLMHLHKDIETILAKARGES